MWCNELSKSIIKECIVEIDNKPIHIHYLNSKCNIVSKHVQERDIEERDIKLVMDETNLNREKAIKELQKNDIVTVLMNYIN